jgi:hypothetical protein
MKLSSGVLIAGSVIAGVAGFGSYHWHMVNTVFADEPLESEFFRTYDPGPLLNKYGAVHQRPGSTGGNASAQTRGITRYYRVTRKSGCWPVSGVTRRH